MKIVFAGTPDFARAALEALFDAGHEVALVLTRPDRLAGRGMRLVTNPVKDCALRHGVPVAQPAGLRLDGRHGAEAQAVHAQLEAIAAHVMVVAAYGLILPASLLALPKHGGLNIHASLLPRWRGAAPIERAIEAGDRETGISIMQMDAGLDTGPVLDRAAQTILAEDSAGSLRVRLQDLGARLIVKTLARLEAGPLSGEPQPDHGVTYADKLTKAEAALRFDAPAPVLARRIRAFDPHPGASARCDGATFKLWHARSASADGAMPPGTIVAIDREGVHVACEPGLLCITELQRPGGRRLAAAQFLQGTPLVPGQRLT